jgi:hypothetical protein
MSCRKCGFISARAAGQINDFDSKRGPMGVDPFEDALHDVPRHDLRSLRTGLDVQ